MNSIRIGRFLFALFSLIVWIYTLTVGINSFFRYNKFHREYERRSHAISELKERQKKLDHMLASLDDDNVWEFLAREKLHMIKPNEEMFQFYLR